MSEFLGWCICFFAYRRVLDFLELQVTFWDSSIPSSRPVRARSQTIAEIAEGTQVADWRVRACLRRLTRKGLVEQDEPDRWRVVLFPLACRPVSSQVNEQDYVNAAFTEELRK